MKDKDLQNRLSDIQMIKRAIDKSKSTQTKTLFGVTLEANLIVQAVGLIVAIQLLICELYFQRAFDTLAKLGVRLEYTIQNMSTIAFILVLLVACLYYVAWRAAKHSNEQFGEYLGKNFSYLKNMSLVSDLAVKLMAVAIVALSGKLIWMSPLLMAFIGDYLIQGRYFTIRLTPSIILGLFCFLASVAMFYFEVSTILMPLIMFMALSIFSLGRLCVLKYSEEKSENQ